MSYELNERVSISGDVEYGNVFYRVCSQGTIKNNAGKELLVNIDIINGDLNANVFVDSDCISKIK